MPRSENYETDILVHLYNDPKALPKFSGLLEPYHFKNQVKGDIYAVMRELWRKYKERPSLTAIAETIAEELKDTSGLSRFTEDDLPIIETVLKSIASNKYVSGNWLEDTLKSWLVESEWERARQRMTEAAIENDHRKYDEIIRETRVNIAQLEEEEEDFFDSIEDVARSYQEWKKKLIPTGFEQLDYILGGGMMEGEFGMLFGVDGTGKSFMACNIAYSCVTSLRRTLYITNEMSAEDTKIRFMKLFANVSDRDIDEGTVVEKVRRVKQSIQQYKGYLTIKYVPPGSSVDVVWGFLEAAQQEGNPYDVVIVDYLDRFDLPGSNDQDWLKLEKLSAEFSFICKPREDNGMGVCLLALTHARSQADGKSFGSGRDMGRSTIGKNKSIDFGIFLGKSKEDAEQNVIHATVTKMRHRGSQKNTCTLRTDYLDRARLVEVKD